MKKAQISTPNLQPHGSKLLAQIVLLASVCLYGLLLLALLIMVFVGAADGMKDGIFVLAGVLVYCGIPAAIILYFLHLAFRSYDAKHYSKSILFFISPLVIFVAIFMILFQIGKLFFY